MANNKLLKLLTAMVQLDCVGETYSRLQLLKHYSIPTALRTTTCNFEIKLKSLLKELTCSIT